MKKPAKPASSKSNPAREVRKVPMRPAESPSAGREARIPIVGIGASAGGLEPLLELFGNMPQDIGLGFVVVTHQHPGHTSMLPELLGKVTTLPVVEAADGMVVEPNRIHVGPPGGCLAILNGTLHRMWAGKIVRA